MGDAGPKKGKGDGAGGGRANPNGNPASRRKRPAGANRYWEQIFAKVNPKTGKLENVNSEFSDSENGGGSEGGGSEGGGSEGGGGDSEGDEGMAPYQAKDILLVKGILLPKTLRKLQPTEAQLGNAEDLLAPLKDMLVALLGHETVMCLQRNHGSLRAVFERSSPTTQCKNVIPSQTQQCWICGGQIDPTIDALAFECEHVFPIAQALAFTGLYEHSLFEALSDREANAYKAGLELEYKPSHRYCNQIKNDTHFISIDKTGLHIDQQLIQTFLTALSTAKTFGGWLSLQMTQEQILGRQQAIMEVCNPIIEIVNNVNPDPSVHAKQTALYLQEYVAIDPNCGTKEIIPDTKPISPQSGTLTSLLKQTDITSVEYALNKTCNYFFGILNPRIDTIIKAKYAARERAMIKSTLFDLQIGMKRAIYTRVLPHIDRLRDNLMISLLDHTSHLQTHRNTKQLPLPEVWSSYQVIISQLIPMVVLDETRKYFADFLLTELHKIEGPEAFHQALDGIVPGFLKFINDFLDTNARKVYPVVFQTLEAQLITSGEVYALMSMLTGPALANAAGYPYFYQRSEPLRQGGHRTRRRKRVRRRHTRHR